MSATIVYNYKIGDLVTITEISRPGIVDGLSTDNNGTMYRVIYWFNGVRNSVWMYECEIVERKV